MSSVGTMVVMRYVGNEVAVCMKMSVSDEREVVCVIV